jgi:hypothetical protein
MKVSSFGSLCVLVLLSCQSQVNHSLTTHVPIDRKVQLFKDTHVYFGKGANFRNIERSVQLPILSNFYDTALLKVDLNCPNEKCDWWDRSGNLFLLDENGRVYELMRFKTPYRVGATWVLDISDFLPLLNGRKKFGLFIDTWVGPGHAQGDGWLVSADLVFTKKWKARKAVEVIPVFEPSNVEYGNPDLEAMLSAKIKNKRGYKSARLRSYVTGHGQGNSEKCAEFCSKNHTFSFGENDHTVLVWRDNCDQTVTKGHQKGTWKYSRAGWCPGDKVDPIILDIENLPHGSIPISWKPEPYVNDYDGEYDGDKNTPPFYMISTYLILYR